VYFLIIGDTHMPDRADYLPPEIQEGINRLKKERVFDGIFFTGDFSEQALVMDRLREWTGQGFLKRVRGNMDEDEQIPLPVYETYDIPETELRIGLTHGTQIKPRGDRGAAEKFALQKGVQILLTGHSHAADVFLTPSGILILNPGSCVGAWSFIASGIPSFITIGVGGTQITVTLYEKQQVDMHKRVFQFSFEGKKILPVS
jgi:putative phosphoesterase